MKNIFRRSVAVCAAGAAGISLLVLVSWAVGHERIGALGAQYIPMAPSTAGLMILLATAAFLRARRQTDGTDFTAVPLPVRALIILAVVAAAVICSMVGSRVIFGVIIPLERWLNPTTATLDGIPLGLMSPLTAIAFFLNAFTLGLQSLRSGCRRPLREISALSILAAFAISLAVLFSYATGAPLLYGSGTIPMAMLTAITFALLSSGLLLSAGPDAWPFSLIVAEAGAAPPAPGRPSVKGPFLIMVGLFLVIGTTGVFVLRNQLALSRKATQEHLTSIADLKSREIAAWYGERRGDAEVIFNNPFIQSNAGSFLADPGNARLRRDLLFWMESVQKQHRYPAVALYNADRTTRLIASSLADPMDMPCESEFAEALHARGVLVVDLHRHRIADARYRKAVHLSFWIPVLPGAGRDGAALGAFLLQVDPAVVLYPLIQSWPTPSRTAETHLIRREGEEVVFLSEFRHRKDPALTLRIPIRRQPSLPAVLAALGREGIVEGSDIRNIPVLAALRRIPGTPWAMVAKIDQEEIYATLRERARNTGLLLLTVMIATTFGVGLLERRREERRLRTQLVAERELRESELRYHALFSNMMEGFAYCRMLFEDGRPQDFVYLEVNDAFQTLTGLKNVVGRRVSEIIPGIREADPELFEIYGRVALTGKPERFETYVAALQMWFSIAAYSPEKEYFVAVFDVITKRKKDEAALRQQLSFLGLLSRITRAVAERQQPDSMLRVVLERLVGDLPADAVFVLYYDQVADELTVRQHDARSGAVAAAIGLTEGTKIAVEETGMRVSLAGETLYLRNTADSEASICREFAGQGLLSCCIAPLAAGDRVFGLVCVMRRAVDGFIEGEVDFVRQLSDHVALAIHQAQLHENLQGAYDEVRATQQAVLQQERLRALGQMSSGIAHDINNALSPIMMNAELILMKEQSLSDKSRRYLRIVLQAAADIANTVGRMREFYRPREGQETPHALELNAVVRQVIELTRPRWRDMPQKDGIMIDVDTELQTPLPNILGIESELREALTNLVVNAVDAMPQGGRITIGTESLGPGVIRIGEPEVAARVALRVRDTGVGMDEETRLRCLEPFYTRKGERGTGLGLAMVYGIAQRHHAAIEIESALGRGTLFRLVFPVRAGDTAQPAAGAASIPSAGPPLRILCIDDEPLLREGLRQILLSGGHAVECADGGRSGLESFLAARKRGEPFHAVITDLGMPGIDGRNVAQAVKKESPETPVILLTGWGEQMKSEEDIPDGVDLILSKPPKVADLWKALAKLAGA